MPTLFDLIQSRSLKRSSDARKIDFDDFAKKYVFEVTDLEIPAGTNWQNEPYLLGSVPLAPGASFFWNGYLEVAEPILDDYLLMSAFWGPGDYSSAPFFTWTNIRVGQGAGGTRAFGGEVQSADVVLKPSDFDGQVWATGDSTLGSPDATTVSVVLANGAGSDNPITVVRARAAFLVI